MTSDRAAGCSLLLMFVDGGKENRGKGLSKKKKKATSVYSRVCVHARLYLSGGIQRRPKKKKMWSSGSNVCMVTERKPSERFCTPPINEKMLGFHQK